MAKSSKLNFRFEKKVSKWDFSEEIIVAILWSNLEFNKKKIWKYNCLVFSCYKEKLLDGFHVGFLVGVLGYFWGSSDRLSGEISGRIFIEVSEIILLRSSLWIPGGFLDKFLRDLLEEFLEQLIKKNFWGN